MRISGLDGYRGVAYPPFRAGQAINELRYVGWGLVPAPRNVLIRPDQREARLISVEQTIIWQRKNFQRDIPAGGRRGELIRIAKIAIRDEQREAIAKMIV